MLQVKNYMNIINNPKQQQQKNEMFLLNRNFADRIVFIKNLLSFKIR